MVKRYEKLRVERVSLVVPRVAAKSRPHRLRWNISNAKIY
jgi:hypothetical protein